MDKFDFKNYEEFIEKYEFVSGTLKNMESDVIDVEAGIETITQLQESLNTAMNNIVPLTTKINMDLELETLSSEMKIFEDYYIKKACKIEIYAAYLQECVDAINDPNRGSKYVSELWKQIDALLRTNKIDSLVDKIMGNATKFGAFWMLDSFINYFAHTNNSLVGFMISHITDQKYDNGDFVVGDLVGNALKAYHMDSLTQLSVGGGVAVSFFVMLKDLITDEGDLTVTDFKRAGLNGIKHGAEYAAWTYIAGAIGGPTGVGLAVGTTIILDKLLTPACDYIMHENIIHEFNRNGLSYEIPQNGKGKLTYDVIYERLYGEKISDGLTSADRKRKKSMYSDWQTYYPDAKQMYTGDNINAFNYYLNEVQNASSKDEINSMMYSWGLYRDEECEDLNEGVARTFCGGLYKQLYDDGFRFDEYYDYMKGDLSLKPSSFQTNDNSISESEPKFSGGGGGHNF